MNVNLDKLISDLKEDILIYQENYNNSFNTRFADTKLHNRNVCKMFAARELLRYTEKYKHETETN